MHVLYDMVLKKDRVKGQSHDNYYRYFVLVLQFAHAQTVHA